MKETIYYVGYYALEDKSKRYFAPSANTKMNYVIDLLIRNDKQVSIISTSQTTHQQHLFFSSMKQRIKENVDICFSATMGGKGLVYKTIKYLWINMWLFFQLLSIRKNDTVLFYHSLDLIFVITLVRKIKKFNLVIECEELYNDVKSHKILNRNFELKKLKSADAYIFPTMHLSNRINSNKSIIIHGTYTMNNNVDISFLDEKKHVVYSGILDPKKGVNLAVGTAEFLDSDYVLHILGYGTQLEIDALEKLIEKTNYYSSCQVIYEGLLLGDEYSKFLGKCNIGLCTQEKNAEFNNSSFPSKILSYLTNGLEVVTISMPTLRESELDSLLTYYYNDDPEEIASSIKSIFHKNNKLEIYNTVSQLDLKSEKQMGDLLEKLKKGKV